jgi:CRISPR/Cas system CSM-associated protein Csm4 (group 5 of RAMP superfamily)
MNDIIKENNQLRESQILNTKANEMSKVEFVTMNILNGLLTNSNLNDIDVDEITDRVIEISKTLIKKLS